MYKLQYLLALKFVCHDALLIEDYMSTKDYWDINSEITPM